VVRFRSQRTPVLLLEGPRGVGKSTLLDALAAELGASVFDLDQEDYRRIVQSNPSAVAGGKPLVIVDEYQKVPELLDAIKARLNQETRPGMFILSGSSSYDSLPEGTQALTGRMERLLIAPLTQTEIDGTANDLFEYAFEGDIQHTPSLSATGRTAYVGRVLRGGMPLALVQDSEADRSRWFAAYVRQSVERDAGNLRRLGRRTDLRNVLIRAVGQTGSVFSVNRVARDVEPSWDTTAAYVELLESLFLIARLPAWGVTLLPRSVESPKIHVVDSGVGGHLLRLSADKLARLDPSAMTEYGHLFESFIVQEVVRQTAWLDAPVSCGYWRTREQLEVDLVLERYDGAVVGIEVKAGERVDKINLSPLVKLRDRLGPSFKAGIVFYTGGAGFRADDRIHVLPADRLWT